MSRYSYTRSIPISILFVQFSLKHASKLRLELYNTPQKIRQLPIWKWQYREGKIIPSFE